MKKLSTALFIDYDAWFWGLFNSGDRPDVKGLVKQIGQEAQIDHMCVFGDFTKNEMKKEILKIKHVTSNIIDCTDPETRRNYTGFVMLDNIYRTLLENKDIEQFVLVTGDGRFADICSYLMNFKNKKIGVCYPENQLNDRLKGCCSWHYEIKPRDVKEDIEQYLVVVELLRNIKWAEEKGVYPSFNRTIDITSKYSHIPKERLVASLHGLIEKRLVKQVSMGTKDGKEIRVVQPEWHLLEERGFWNK